MKYFFLIVFFATNLIYANDNLQITILTCSPGEEIYSVFGHTAIRVLDKENKTDEVYNFGMFDFNTPNFTYKFLKGKLQYYRGIQHTKEFIDLYTLENRLVREQILNLTNQEKRQFLEELKILCKAENKNYYYSFLEKNCSTETRDLLMSIGVIFKNEKLEKSNRELILEYLQDLPWIRLGVNTVLGMSVDQKSSRIQSMFLPDYLEKEIGLVTNGGGDLVQAVQSLNSVETKKSYNLNRCYSPIIVFSLFLLLFMFWFPKSIKLAVCSLVGLSGLLLIMLCFFSEHQEVNNNLNLLWCNPLYLLFIPLILKNKSSKLLSIVMMFFLIACVGVWLLNIQQFDIAIIPVLIILGNFNLNELRKNIQNEN